MFLKYDRVCRGIRSMKGNPFTLSFGSSPSEHISRVGIKDSLSKNLEAEPPLSHCFIITGVRGSGKTVLLTSIAKEFEKNPKWVVVELNPEDDMRESLAAKLYSSSKTKHLFLQKSFSVSFHGVSFSLSGKNPVLNIDDLLEKMLVEIKRQKKKVLVLVDKATSNPQMKRFALSFQILIRKDCPLFLLATGLYENISTLQNEKNLTFLIRAPKTFLSPLNISSIALSYQNSIGITYEEALEYAKLTKGYAFAFQLLGYLLFESGNKKIDYKLLIQFDQYLSEFVYTKVWSSLSPVEQNIAKTFKTNEEIGVNEVLSRNEMTKEYFSQYRDRLLKKGILTAPSRGRLCFALPRFKEFIDTH